MIRLIAASLLVIASAFVVPGILPSAFAQTGGVDPQSAVEAEPPAQAGQAEGPASDPARDGPAEATPEPAATPAAKQSKIPDLIPTSVFAARSAISNAQLSKDGTVATFLRRNDRGTKLVVVDPRSGQLINSISFASGTSIEWTRWVDADKMLIKIWGVRQLGRYIVRHSKLLIAYPSEGQFDYLVENQTGLNGGDVLHIDDVGEYALIAHRGDGRLWQPTVFRYELKPGGTVTKIQKPKNEVSRWVADNKGVVRLGLGWRRGRLLIFYRENAGDKLKTIARVKPGDAESYFDAIEIISDSDRGYVLDEAPNGRVGLRIFDYSTREVVETVYEHPEWDLEEAWFEDGEPVAVTYTGDREQIVWFDDGYRKVQEELEATIGDKDVWVTSRSKDGKKLLVWIGNEADPGVLHFYDAGARSLSEFGRTRPNIDTQKLARPKAISYTARDGTEIRAYLTIPKGREASNLPLIILPHGGPFGVRDQLRYDDEVQFLANRGYAVIQPNFRGSGGYGSEFYDLGIGEVGQGMQDDLDDALDWAVNEGIADPNRVCMVGGSYGGYAALWAVLRNPERYRCAASWAGVTDWERMLSFDRKVLTRRAGERWVAKIQGDDGRSLQDVSPYRLAENLSRPVLLAHGTSDDNVPFKQYEQMVKAAREAPVRLETLVIEDEGHSFSSAKNEQRWYDALDRFLAKHNPADQVDSNGELKIVSKPAQPSIFTDIALPQPAEAE